MSGPSYWTPREPVCFGLHKTASSGSATMSCRSLQTLKWPPWCRARHTNHNMVLLCHFAVTLARVGPAGGGAPPLKRLCIIGKWKSEAPPPDRWGFFQRPTPSLPLPSPLTPLPSVQSAPSLAWRREVVTSGLEPNDNGSAQTFA